MLKFLTSKYLKTALILIISLVSVISANAQRLVEKNVTAISGQSGYEIDEISNTNLTSINFNLYGNTQFTVLHSSANGKVTVNSNASIKGTKKVTATYVVNNNGTNETNYRVYNITFVKSIVKASDDIVIWDGVSNLTIDVKANDVFTGAASIKVNHSSGSFAVVGGNIEYSNANFTGPDYIHYTITDTAGTADRATVKIDKAQAAPTEDVNKSFVVNYASSKLVSVPAGFTVTQDPFNGTLDSKGGNHFVYTPAEFFVGLDSFKFENAGGLVYSFNAKVIDPIRDAGVVKNDKFYTPQNTSVSFDVFKNDLINNLIIDTFSQQMTHESLGVFTVNPIATAGLKNYFYEVTTGVGVEKGKIKLNVGNFVPDRDIKYDISVLGNKPFVMEYDVPITGYGFSVLSQASHGVVSIYADSTTTSCGNVYGKAIIVYTPDNGYTGQDEFSLNYCINGTQCKIVKVFPNVLSNPNNDCNCVDNCVWSGDLNGDGIVSGQDLLILGRFIGASGPLRSPNNNSQWSGEAANPWDLSMINGRDLMHADANGDGSITSEDMEAISDNFNKINSFVPKENLGYKDFPFSLIAIPETVDSGEVQTIYFVLGSETTPANGVTGISFGVNIADADSASVQVDMYNDSWLTEDAPSLSLWKQVKKGDVRIAVTKTAGGIIGEDADGFRIGGTSGNGVIGQMSIIGEDADGFRDVSSDFIYKTLVVDNIIVEDVDGEKFSVEDASIQLKQTRKIKNTIAEDKVYVFPNPASNQIDILGANINSFEIYNLNGRILLSNAVNKEHSTINVSNLSNGVYIMKINTASGIQTRKIVISK